MLGWEGAQIGVPNDGCFMVAPCGSWVDSAGGILLALLSASASAFVIKAVLGEQRPSEEHGCFSAKGSQEAGSHRQVYDETSLDISGALSHW